MAESKQFASVEERDEFITKAFPDRKCSDVPGFYNLPNGWLRVEHLLVEWEIAQTPFDTLSEEQRAAVVEEWTGIDQDGFINSRQDALDLAQRVSNDLMCNGTCTITIDEVKTWWDGLDPLAQADIIPKLDPGYALLPPNEKAARALREAGIEIDATTLDKILKEFDKPTEAKDANSK